MNELIEGIVISETPSGETSKIISVLTSDGVIGIMAKGARNLKSNLRSGTNKLTLGYFSLNKKNDNFQYLKSVDIINNFNNIKKDINKVSYSSYIIELASQVMRLNKFKLIYKLLIDSLNKINDGFDYRVITNILELKYLEYLGVLPVLDECSICGSKENIITLSGSRGGYICKNCLTNDIIVNKKTLKIIRMFYYVDISKIDKLEISEEIKNKINEFLDSYYDLYTGLYLKTKFFLNRIKR